MSENAETSLAEVAKWLKLKKADIAAIDTNDDMLALQAILKLIEKKIGVDKVNAHIKAHYYLDSVEELALQSRMPAAAMSITITRLMNEYA